MLPKFAQGLSDNRIIAAKISIFVVTARKILKIHHSKLLHQIWLAENTEAIRARLLVL